MQQKNLTFNRLKTCGVILRSDGKKLELFGHNTKQSHNNINLLPKEHHTHGAACEQQHWAAFLQLQLEI